MTNQEMVQQFMEKHKLPIPRQGAPDTDGLALKRARLIVEEAFETVVALDEKDYIALADALADLLYVTYGTAVTYGIPLDEVFKEVHRSNMTKPSLNEHAKGGKGPGYSPPDISSVIARHGENRGI